MAEDSRPLKKQPDQLNRFKEAARALECDDDPEALDKVTKKIAKAKPYAKK